MSEAPRLQLHIPTPHARPGDEATFAHLQVSPAGAVCRPEMAAPEADLRDLPYALIRVLDEGHKAVGPWDPGLV